MRTCSPCLDIPGKKNSCGHGSGRPQEIRKDIKILDLVKSSYQRLWVWFSFWSFSGTLSRHRFSPPGDSPDSSGPLFHPLYLAALVGLVHWLSSRKRQETYLSFFGPFALLLLLVVWATGLIFGFAILHWASGSTIQPAGGNPGFTTDLYFSATTFFTLGLGDVIPRTPMAKALTAVQAGVGFGFLALVIGFLPALNQSFSRREVNISLLDARAGSPPTAAEVLRRHSYDHGLEALQILLRDWEGWSAELLESHLSYPMLAFFRSQHDNQSWLGALTAILDTCALIMAGLEGACERQAELTFAIARHTAVDLRSSLAASASTGE